MNSIPNASMATTCQVVQALQFEIPGNPSAAIPVPTQIPAAHMSVSGQKPILIQSAKDPKAMATESRTAMQKLKSLGARLLGVVCGVGRAGLLLLWSPVTALKYVVVALRQWCAGEAKKALQALALAMTAPLWAPLDGASKTYHRFAQWGDGGNLCDEPGNDSRSWFEKVKQNAKEGVTERGSLCSGRSAVGGCCIC